MHRLKIIKNIEFRKSNSLNEINLKQKKYKEKSRDIQKLYRYYYSKKNLDEKLMKQKITKMKNDLNKKQNEEKNDFKNDFFRKYPSENNYTNEISDFVKEINKYKKENNIKEAKKYEEMKKKFLEEKHDEYLKNMGEEYEQALVKLNEKFKKENHEQKMKIRKIILNHKIGEIEKENENNNNNNKFIIYNRRFFIDGKSNLSQDNIYGLYDINKNGLCSKVFKFGGKGNPYKTVII